MTTFDAHKNFAWGVVKTAPSPAISGTSLVLKTGHGANFQPASFNAVVVPAGTMNPFMATGEAIRVTVKSSDTLTISRAQESTSAVSIAAGDIVMAGVPTKKQLEDIETAINLRMLNTGDTVTGSYNFNASTAGKVMISSSGSGGPALGLYDNVSDVGPKVAMGSVFGIGTFGFGDGTAAPDTFLGRSALNQLNIGFGKGTFQGGLAPSLNAQTGTSYTLIIDDAGKQITRSNASASTQTLPQNSAAAIPVGAVIPITNIGAGVVTFAAGTGATITGLVSIRQYQRALMTKVSTNGWNITGDNSADIVAASIGDVGGNPSKRITLNGNSFTYSTFSDHTFKIWDGVSSYSQHMKISSLLIEMTVKTSFKNVANLMNYTVGTLPTGTRGDIAYVTDATAPTYLGTLTGGGSVVCPVFYNGTAWVAH